MFRLATCRDRATRTCNLLDLSGTDSPSSKEFFDPAYQTQVGTRFGENCRILWILSNSARRRSGDFSSSRPYFSFHGGLSLQALEITRDGYDSESATAFLVRHGTIATIEAPIDLDGLPLLGVARGITHKPRVANIQIVLVVQVVLARRKLAATQRWPPSVVNLLRILDCFEDL